MPVELGDENSNDMMNIKRYTPHDFSRNDGMSNVRITQYIIHGPLGPGPFQQPRFFLTSGKVGAGVVEG